MKVKICGLNPVRDVQLCIDLKVNFLGFVFYKKSPRNLNVQDIDRLKDYDRKKSSFCAVTVNPDDEFIKNRILKETHWFLMDYKGDEITIPQIKEGITEVCWKSLEESNKLASLSYPSISAVWDSYLN